VTRIKRDSIAYVLIIVFCIVMLGWGIPANTPDYPGYGAPSDLVPNVSVSVMLFMACLSLFYTAIAIYLKKHIPSAEREFPEDLKDGGGFTQVGRINLFHLGAIMLPCVLLLPAIEYLGYIPASIAFLMALQYVIGCRNWVQSIVVSLALTATLYVVMRYGFGVPVPGPQLF